MRIACPHCNVPLDAEERKIGQDVHCPKCHQLFRVAMPQTPQAEIPTEITEILPSEFVQASSKPLLGWRRAAGILFSCAMFYGVTLPFVLFDLQTPDLEEVLIIFPISAFIGMWLGTSIIFTWICLQNRNETGCLQAAGIFFSCAALGGLSLPFFLHVAHSGPPKDLDEALYLIFIEVPLSAFIGMCLGIVLIVTRICLQNRDIIGWRQIAGTLIGRTIICGTILMILFFGMVNRSKFSTQEFLVQILIVILLSAFIGTCIGTAIIVSRVSRQNRKKNQ